MGFDIYGNRLLPGHCEVHPYVHEEFPCSICMAERSTQARQPDGPLCGICGKFEACADSCGVPVCSEACDHEAQRRHNKVETLRAELAAERARAESLHQRLVALEDEKNTYMDYVGDALGQDHDRETLWDAAQRVLSDRDRLRAAGRSLLACPHIDERDTDPDWVDAETEAAVAEMRDALGEAK